MKKALLTVALILVSGLAIGAAVTHSKLTNTAADHELHQPGYVVASAGTITPIANATPGDVLYEADTNQYWVWNGFGWSLLGYQSTPTKTWTPTFTPSPTITFSPTPTPTITLTPTCNATLTPACANQNTPTPVNTSTPTPTFTVTSTPQPTLTPITGSRVILVGEDQELDVQTLTSAGSIIHCAISAHDLNPGDFAVLSGATNTALNGPLWPVVNVPDANHFDLQTTVANPSGSLGTVTWSFFATQCQGLQFLKTLTGTAGTYALTLTNTQPSISYLIRAGNFSGSSSSGNGGVMTPKSITTTGFTLTCTDVKNAAIIAPDLYFFFELNGIQ